jgi:3-oxoacyl-[acyl-carrier-protein] synthase-3
LNRPVVELVGTGRYVPDLVYDNAYFEQLVDTSDEWIRERTGILERHIASDEETLAFMATRAANQVLDDAGITALDVDGIVLGTATADRLLPSTACDMQAELGAKNAAAFDIAAACSSFLYALSIAEGMVLSGDFRNVLVVGGDRLSRITDYTDRATCILFGDGVGATLVRPTTDGDRGLLASYLKTDGTLANLLYRPGGGCNHPPDEKLLEERGYYIKMAGREVFKSAVRSMAEACDRALERAGVRGEEVDLLIPHQANIRIIEGTGKHAGIPMEKVYVNIDRYGNTSAASIPIALDECVRSGRIGPGSLVLMVAFGGGFTWASALVRW